MSGRREREPEPSWVLHDAPSCGMSLISCEEGTDEAGPKELRETWNTWSARSCDGHVGCLSQDNRISLREESPRFIIPLSREWTQWGWSWPLLLLVEAFEVLIN